jgi:hypothetical protein
VKGHPIESDLTPDGVDKKARWRWHVPAPRSMNRIRHEVALATLTEANGELYSFSAARLLLVFFMDCGEFDKAAFKFYFIQPFYASYQINSYLLVW